MNLLIDILKFLAPTRRGSAMAWVLVALNTMLQVGIARGRADVVRQPFGPYGYAFSTLLLFACTGACVLAVWFSTREKKVEASPNLDDAYRGSAAGLAEQLAEARRECARLTEERDKKPFDPNKGWIALGAFALSIIVGMTLYREFDHRFVPGASTRGTPCHVVPVTRIGKITLGPSCGGDLAGTVSNATVGGLQGSTVSNSAPGIGNTFVVGGGR